MKSTLEETFEAMEKCIVKYRDASTAPLSWFVEAAVLDSGDCALCERFLAPGQRNCCTECPVAAHGFAGCQDTPWSGQPHDTDLRLKTKSVELADIPFQDTTDALCTLRYWWEQSHRAQGDAVLVHKHLQERCAHMARLLAEIHFRMLIDAGQMARAMPLWLESQGCVLIRDAGDLERLAPSGRSTVSLVVMRDGHDETYGFGFMYVTYEVDDISLSAYYFEGIKFTAMRFNPYSPQWKDKLVAVARIETESGRVVAGSSTVVELDMFDQNGGIKRFPNSQLLI